MKVLVIQFCLTLCNPVDSSPPGSFVHGILQARILERVAIPSPGDIPDPGIEPRSPALQADSLPSEPRGKHMCLYVCICVCIYIYVCVWTSLIVQLIKNLPAMQEIWVQFLGQENPLEKGKATHSSILAWRIPWTV